jgi:hypothetical protein
MRTPGDTSLAWDRVQEEKLAAKKYANIHSTESSLAFSTRIGD